MTLNKKEVKGRLFSKIPSHFIDPMTRLKPTGEVELSALLGLFHNKGLIEWNRVPLYETDNTRTNLMADAIIAKGEFCSEYPLFVKGDLELEIWNGMKADLMYISKDMLSIALIENKIGSEFTSGGNDVKTGQIARQAQYLMRSKVPNKYIVLLSSKDFFEAGWYSTELRNTLLHQDKQRKLKSFLLYWEDIFQAIRK